MIKKARRVFAAVVAVLLVCFTAAPVLSANAATQNSWNFKNSNFKKLGTIKSSTTVDGLGLMATSSKNMKVKAESVTVDGTAYTYCLALSGTGTTSYRSVKVPVSGSDTIKVVLRSSGSSTRNLIVADSNGKKLGTIAANKTASLGTYSYSGSKGYIYLYSENSGITKYRLILMAARHLVLHQEVHQVQAALHQEAAHLQVHQQVHLYQVIMWLRLVECL